MPSVKQPSLYAAAVDLMVLFCDSAIGAAFTQQHFKAMVNGADDCQNIFLGGFLAAGKIDDKALLSYACGAAA